MRRNPVEELAEEFLDRYRRGERPALTEYTRRHPELAEEIRDLFPALVMMEEAGPKSVAPGAPGAARAAASAGAYGERLGDYRILCEVGRGGMGIVYEAEQESLSRHVALKVLPAQFSANSTYLLRFRREARSAARLHHTNIVPVFDVGEFQGTHYYAMQFIQGQGLDEVLDELRRLRGVGLPERGGMRGNGSRSPDPNLTAGLAQGLLTNQFAGSAPGESGAPPVAAPAGMENAPTLAPPACLRSAALTQSAQGLTDPAPASGTSSVSADNVRGPRSELSAQSDYHFYRSTARVGLQVAEALAYAHAQKVLHRDIKPANLLLDLQGITWVTDFGLAKEQGDDLTQTGDLVGTLRYMAPERFSGLSDARSDVYSLGLTLYELVTLCPAFDETDRGRLIKRITHEDPPRPRKLDPRLPRDLETIILKATAKEPRLRYQSADEMCEDLRRFLTDRPIRARRSAVWEHAWRWCRRNPLVAGLTALVMVLLLVLAVGVPLAALLREERDRALIAEADARAAEKRAQKAEGQVAFRSHLAQAAAFRHAGQVGQNIKSLDEVKKALPLVHQHNLGPQALAEVRNEAIAALALPDLHITKEFGSFPPGSVWVELNEDFTLYVRTTDKGDCIVRRVDDDSEVARLPALGEPAQADFGAGRLLAVLGKSSNCFQLWDLRGPEPVRRFEELGIAHWCFRADGRLVALAHMDDCLSVYETASGKCIHHVTSPSNGSLLNPALHPTEPFVACYSYLHRGVPVYDLRTGKVVPGVMTPWPGGSSACWRPDGRSLFVTECDGGAIQEYAFAAAAPALRLVRTIQGPITHTGADITFNPAGDRFVRRGWGNVVGLFDAVSGQELCRTHSMPPASDSSRLRFDRAGQRLAGARVGDRKDRIGLWSVAEGRAYRSLVHPGSAESQSDRPAIHPGGRLAALALVDGVALFDLESGRELAHLPISPRGCYVRFDGTGNLLTSGFEGCYRWPVRPDSATPGRLLVGPPERLPLHPGSHAIAASQDGRVIGQCMWSGYGEQAFAGGWILHPNSPMPRLVDAGLSIGQCSVSPDGRWVAFGGPHLAATRHGIHIYDAATAQRVWQCPAHEGDMCRFSPDGRWLLTDTDGGRLYAVGTWEPGPRLGPGKPWGVTSDLVVLGQTDGIYRLVELASGRELARLEDPKHDFGAAALTPDGTKLVVSAKNGLRVWDLRLIRAQLAKLGLDWEAPPLPAASPPSPLSIQPALSDTLLRAQAHVLVVQARRHARAKEHARALAALQQAVKIAPSIAEAHNELSWLLSTAPKDLRDPDLALRSARKAIELEPKQPTYVNTLGVALYYSGQFAEAIPLLERSLRQQNGQADSYDLFFLAMCHHRLGDAARAQECLRRGKQWFLAHKGRMSATWLEELTAIQAEADSVLAQPPSPGKK